MACLFFDSLLDDGDALQMSTVQLKFLDAQGGVVKAVDVYADETKVSGHCFSALLLIADLLCTHQFVSERKPLGQRTTDTCLACCACCVNRRVYSSGSKPTNVT